MTRRLRAAARFLFGLARVLLDIPRRAAGLGLIVGPALLLAAPAWMDWGLCSGLMCLGVWVLWGAK